MCLSRPTHSTSLITVAISLIPLVVTRLLLSLRQASHSETIAATMTRDHFTPSDTQESTTRRVSRTKVVGTVLVLSDFGNQDKRHPGVLGCEAWDVMCWGEVSTASCTVWISGETFRGRLVEDLVMKEAQDSQNHPGYSGDEFFHPYGLIQTLQNRGVVNCLGACEPRP
jgi:hypothetical protein